MKNQIHKYNLKNILLIILIFSLLFIQVSSESVSDINKNKSNTQISSTKNIATSQVTTKNVSVKKNNNVKKTINSSTKKSTFTPKKYRKNFVIRIPRTNYRSVGPRRITITRTTPPVTFFEAIPTHTSEEVTTYYSTFAYDFISPSPEPSRYFRKNKSPITNKNVKSTIPITKAP